ncbi:hypothetical protein Tco_0318407 [Tanacetum coccineum]
MESVFHISNCVVKNQVKFATCTFLINALTWWNSYMKTVTQDLALMCGRMFHEESDEVKKYVGGLLDMIRANVMSYQPKGHQQQNKRQNTRRAYTAGPGEKRKYTRSLPLSSGPNGNNNNRGNSGTTQNASTCYEYGVQWHFKRDCSELKNRNHGDQGGNGNAPAKVYVVGNMLLSYASILFDTGVDRSFVINV